MTATIVIETIGWLLNTIGLIGVGIGVYQYFLKCSKQKGNHIWAYAYFFLACSDALQSAYIIMIFCEVVAINCFRDYVYGKR